MFLAGTGNSTLGTYLIVDELSFGWLAGVSDYSKANFELYPNPTTKSFTINHFDSNLFDIQAYSVIGEEVVLNMSKQADNKVLIDVSELQKGVYSVNLINKQTGEISIKKFIVE
jgi:hypothetical protein